MMPAEKRLPFTQTPWHKASFDAFIGETLPRLLDERLSLSSYTVEDGDAHTFSLRLAVQGDAGAVEVRYTGLPRPDADGLFLIDGSYRVVLPYPTRQNLAEAQILCVGEQLNDYITQRLGEAPAGLAWDAESLRAWLPLDEWLHRFHAGPTSQYLQTGNWLDRLVHRRRLTLVPICPEPLEPEQIFPSQNMGLVCPFNTPEGPNIGRLLELAGGAAIRDGRLVRLETGPEAALGVAASLVPLLPHDDSNRALMAMRMMRQWLVAADPQAPMHRDGPFRRQYDKARASQGTAPEPALVRTGHEPEAADFWGGYNLLSAFIMWDDGTFEDGIVVSRSCAERLDFPHRLEVGDRLSNRHGAKGTVTRILPDAEMPRMPDGTPVDLIYSPTSMVSRLNFGQAREAVLGRLAQKQGAPFVVAPLQAPGADELQRLLQEAGLPDDGMERLSLAGSDLPHRSTVGWVYWGRLDPGPRERLSVPAGTGGRAVGVLAYRALMANGAYASIHEYLNTCSAERPDAAGLAASVEAGAVQPAPPPTPRFGRLQRFLALAGIRADLQEDGLHFSLHEPGEVPLAEALEHPWSPGHSLHSLGDFEALEDGDRQEAAAARHADLLEANANLRRLLDGKAPEPLLQPARQRLRQRLDEFLEELLQPANLRFGTRVLFSGGGVAAPGPELDWEEVGLPDELARALFEPLVKNEMGAAFEAGSAAAEQALDAVMARSWVVLYNGQEVMEDTAHGPAYHIPPTSLIACRPRRHPEPVIRLHPRLSGLLEVDFDGDPLSVFLPVTEEAQREAADLLSLRGHLRRDAAVFGLFTDNYHGMLWGLSCLWENTEGRRRINAILGNEDDAGYLDKRRLNGRLYRLFQDGGAEPLMRALEELRHLGGQASKESGASFSPFLGAGIDWPQPPAGDDPDLWELYFDEALSTLYREAESDADGLGPLVRLSRSGARGNGQQLRRYIAAHGPQQPIDGQEATVRHGLVEGRDPTEVLQQAPRALWGLAAASRQWSQAVEESAQGWMRDLSLEPAGTTTLGILSRALRSRRPGLVFARAAAGGDIDPLASVSSRLFVGLPL